MKNEKEVYCKKCEETIKLIPNNNWKIGCECKKKTYNEIMPSCWDIKNRKALCDNCGKTPKLVSIEHFGFRVTCDCPEIQSVKYTGDIEIYWTFNS